MEILTADNIEKKLAEIIGVEVEQRVQRTVDSLNLRIRDKIRDSTGLRLNHGQLQEKIPVRLVPDLPKPFVDVLEGMDEKLVNWLFRHSEHLNVTKDMLDSISFYYPTIVSGLARVEPAATQEEVASVSAFVDQLLELKKKLLSPDILKTDETPEYTGREFFGCYMVGTGEVKIHWVAIGMFVALHDEYKHSVENMTAFVLAHELAHAYTHRGFDTDGRQWNTEDFRDADKYIIEGLAQYYTGVVSERMESIQPGMQWAFEDLLKYLADVYRDFVNWIPDHSHQKEIIRLVMIESTRVRGIQEYAEFKSELERFAVDWSGDT